MAAIFIAQATNVHLSLGEQLGILGVLLLTSKGSAAVTGGGFITLAATLESTGKVPVAGLALLLGIDRFMSEARAITNLIGNGVATMVVARWEGALDLPARGRFWRRTATWRRKSRKPWPSRSTVCRHRHRSLPMHSDWASEPSTSLRAAPERSTRNQSDLVPGRRPSRNRRTDLNCTILSLRTSRMKTISLSIALVSLKRLRLHRRELPCSSIHCSAQDVSPRQRGEHRARRGKTPGRPSA